jgi:hypothetical protein
MKRLLICAALAPVAAAACGYGLARQMARYFDNPLDVLDRIAMETNDYIDSLPLYDDTPNERSPS